MELNIGCFDVLAGLEKPGCKACGHCHGAGAEQDILKPDLGLPHQAGNLVVQCRLVALVDQTGLQMVLKVLADSI